MSSPFRCTVKQLHSLAPVLTVVSQKSSNQSLIACSSNSVSQKTSLLNNSRSLLKVDLHSRLYSGKDVFSRSFGTSSQRAAKELSDKGDVVYKGAISGMIKGVKLFSLSTSAMGLCLQPMVLFSNQEMPTGLKFAFGGIINFFVFVNPFIIHYIAKKYVTEMRWNRSTGVFTAVTYTFFLQRRELQFTADHVIVPDIPGMFTFLEAKGTPLFLDPQGFQDNEAYVHLMGFDKPLDWELPPPAQQPKKEEPQKG